MFPRFHFFFVFCQNSRFRCLPTLLLFKWRLKNWRRFFVGCCHADAVAVVVVVVVAVVAAVAVDGGADVNFIAVFMLKEFLSLLPLLLVLVLLLLLLLVMMLGLLL